MYLYINGALYDYDTGIPENINGYWRVGACSSTVFPTPLIHYSFDTGTISGTTLTNLGSCGQACNGLLVNGPTLSTTDLRVGTASLVFNAILSQYVTIPACNLGGAGFTFALWLKVSAGIGNWARVFDFGSGVNTAFYCTINSGALRCDTFQPTIASVVNVIFSVADNKWRHFAVTVDTSGKWRTYVDGVLKATNNVNYPPAGNRSVNFLGKSSQSTSDPTFLGSMDDFRVYDQLLSNRDIYTLYINSEWPSMSSCSNFRGQIYLAQVYSSRLYSAEVQKNYRAFLLSSPIICSAGTVAVANQLECSDCAAGRYASSSGQSLCVQAAAGKFSCLTSGQTSLPGPASGASFECNCPRGTYSLGGVSVW